MPVYSALQIFSELAHSYVERGVGMYFVHMRSRQLEAFKKIQIDRIVSRMHVLGYPADEENSTTDPLR
jgi:hypothetical protein